MNTRDIRTNPKTIPTEISDMIRKRKLLVAIVVMESMRKLIC